jgi:hypothetical protein
MPRLSLRSGSHRVDDAVGDLAGEERQPCRCEVEVDCFGVIDAGNQVLVVQVFPQTRFRAMALVSSVADGQ